MRKRVDLDLPELADYHDEPRQAPSGGIAKTGILRMRFVDRGDKTIMREMYRKAPLLVQQALYWDEQIPDMACVYMISTSGCVLQGDRLHVDVHMETDAVAYITTQSATKVHEMDANHASQLQRIVLDENAYLEFLPGTTIPHRDSRYVARTDIVIDPSATLLFSETVMSGRKYHGAGEFFDYDLYSALVKARRPDGTRLFTEKLVVEPKKFPVRIAGVMGDYDVFANVILLTPPEHVEAVYQQTPSGHFEDVYAGVSRLPNEAGLIYKVIGRETAPVHAKVREFWKTVRATVRGVSLGEPPLWG